MNSNNKKNNDNNNNNSAWETVKLARHPERPTAIDLINHIFTDFIELRGDRQFGDDASIIGGIGFLGKTPVTIIAQEKGIKTDEKIKRNFGMPHPEGYRKALRLMKQAEKFRRPIITIIDTPGAYPGIGAEMRGQAGAIAVNLQEMFKIKTPIISLVLSEGGSGGALAIGISDMLAMYENAIYSILSPEGFAAILYKDNSLANKAAELMKITAKDLLEFKIADNIILEKEGLHINKDFGYGEAKKWLNKVLKELTKLPVDELLHKRYEKFRNYGIYETRLEVESDD